MLISCPKCHNIYEIPDDLIPKTGKKFRCQSCAHIWHALPSDALGYEKETAEKPIIEPIEVPVPPYRPYPANKEKYQVPADGKSGRKTVSSQELLKSEGNPDYVVEPAPKLHLMSSEGTSFTLNMPSGVAENAPTIPEELFAPQEKPLETPTVTTKHQNFIRGICLYILIFIALAGFMRREIVAFYPSAEIYYQKFGLSGQQNPEILNIEDVKAVPFTKNGLNGTLIQLQIVNNTMYQTIVPELTVSPLNLNFRAQTEVLPAHQKTSAEVFIPHTEPESLTIRFLKP